MVTHTRVGSCQGKSKMENSPNLGTQFGDINASAPRLMGSDQSVDFNIVKDGVTTWTLNV